MRVLAFSAASTRRSMSDDACSVSIRSAPAFSLTSTITKSAGGLRYATFSAKDLMRSNHPSPQENPMDRRVGDQNKKLSKRYALCEASMRSSASFSLYPSDHRDISQVKKLALCQLFFFLFFLPVSERRFDRVLCKDRAVDFYRGKRELFYDMGVFDFESICYRLAFDEFSDIT